MSKIQAPRGTLDILPAESWKWQTVERMARETAALYAFAEVRTPMFEHTELFHRGVGESKQRYREALVAFLSPKKDKLSEDSQRRLTENPLRILDSKDPRDQETIHGAPPAAESLSDKSRKHFERVRELLGAAKVVFEVNPNLVRGFDYYTETLW